MTYTAFQANAFQNNAFQIEGNPGGGGGGLSPYMVEAYKEKFREQGRRLREKYEEVKGEAEALESLRLQKAIEPYVVEVVDLNSPHFLDAVSFEAMAANQVATDKLLRIIAEAEKSRLNAILAQRALEEQRQRNARIIMMMIMVAN